MNIEIYNLKKVSVGYFKTLLTFIVAFMLLAMISTSGYAAFALNFDQNADGTTGGPFLGACGNGGGDCPFSKLASANTLDTTSPWFYETYLDPATGFEYWHMIIGELAPTLDAKGRAPGFYQDVYIRMGSDWSYMEDTQQGFGQAQAYGTSLNSSFSDSGGFASGLTGRFNGLGWEEATQDYTDPGGGDVDMIGNPETCEALAGSGCDPLREDAVWSGNGTANPKRVLMRQVNNDGTGSYTEFLKDVENAKARITQEIDDGDILAEFQVDMRGSDYDTNTVTIPLSSTIGSANTMVNKVSVISAPGGAFDLAANGGSAGQTVLNSAGKYTWSPGASAATNTSTNGTSEDNGTEYGWLDPVLFPAQPTYRDVYYASHPNYEADKFMPIPIYDHGGYTYAEDSFDHLGQKWKSIMDTAQNVCGGDPFC